MRGHTRFGHQVHGLGAHLELNVHTGRPHQGGVQRLVAVDLGNGDVVFELAGQGFVDLVQQAQSGVAIDDRGHDDAQAINVGDLGKAQVFFIHLFVDGVERFFTATDAHVHLGLGKNGLHIGLHLADQIAAAVASP